MGEGMEVNIALCQLNKRIAPRFDRCPELVVVTVEEEKPGFIKGKDVIPVAALRQNQLVDLLSRLNVKTLICGGVKDDGQQALKDSDIQLIDNVIGDVDEVVELFVQGKLKRGNTKGIVL